MESSGKDKYEVYVLSSNEQSSQNADVIKDGERKPQRIRSCGKFDADHTVMGLSGKYERTLDGFASLDTPSQDISVTKEREHKPVSQKQKIGVALCILVMELCERLSYFSIMAGLVLYCTSNLGYGQTDASTINQVFSGLAYLLPIIGGFVADSYLGRFKTIVAGCLLYIIGAFFLPLSAIDYELWGWQNLSQTGKRALFMTGLAFVALGTGGIKANVGLFGAEQIEILGPKAIQLFFNWFYWVINIGALVAFACVSYVQQNVSFSWGFFIPFMSQIFALVLFLAAKRYYVTTQPTGSILATAGRIMVQGCCKPSPDRNMKLPDGCQGMILAKAKQSYGGDHEDHVVDGVVSVIKLIPFCLLVIMPWVIAAQTFNTFFAQSERMDIRIGDAYLPAAALNAFNRVSVVVILPFVDRFVYPAFVKIGKPLTYLKRIGIGMVFSVLAVVAAGVVEIYRKQHFADPPLVQTLGGQNFTASSMSVFVQVPQFALIGASEIFIVVSTMEISYNQAPVAMQGLVSGLFLASVGIGTWLSSGILAAVKAATIGDPWWSDDINNSKMEYLLFLLGGLMLLDLLIFCVVAHFYSYHDPATFYKTVNDKETNESNTDLDTKPQK